MDNRFIHHLKIKYKNINYSQIIKYKYIDPMQKIKCKYDIVFSINVHEKINFLLMQLDNIKSYNTSNYCVILNCNQYMFYNLNNIKNTLGNNIFINNIILEKRRFHGSLLNGIYNNMKYAIDNFVFDFFIILSSRNIFFNHLNIDILNKLANNIYKNTDTNIIYNEWWNTRLYTKLAGYYMEKNNPLYRSEHEGLTFSYNVSNIILKFLENNLYIMSDLFNFNHAVEEFTLQTISMNEDNINFGFINIGCGTKTDDIYADRYVYKIIRT